ncbi:MAG: protein kinase [Sandaracinaceae bacterium]|nr:protein kinase [Sandaracinaceae bacterium]
MLQELIGVGGMGRVYRAEQNMLGRTVAVKVIHPHLLGDDQTVARFYNEARAASRLNHPNSVSIIDFGRTEDGILYLVMEHLAGKDLAHVLAEEGPLRSCASAACCATCSPRSARPTRSASCTATSSPRT